MKDSFHEVQAAYNLHQSYQRMALKGILDHELGPLALKK